MFQETSRLSGCVHNLFASYTYLSLARLSPTSMLNTSTKHSIHLTVRVRPPQTSDTPAVSITDGNVVVGGSNSFSYANRVVVGKDQLVCYDAVTSSLLPRIREGYSCAVLAYGETGSGKTHSVFGPPNALTEASLSRNITTLPDTWGVFPRTVMDLLSIPNVSLQASAIEIYQNNPYDLFNERKLLQMPGSRRNSTQTYKHHSAHCTCDLCKEFRSDIDSNEDFATRGTSRKALKTPSDIVQFCQQVELTRTAKSHHLNARSSRSHCLVQIHLRIQKGSSFLQPTFIFVDLAGSERVRKSGVTGDASKEAFGINSSLTTLGRVIQLLGCKNNHHVPYRDSTLTMLLKPLFGGSSFTSVIVNVSSDAAHKEESIAALRFGQRMTLIKNAATVVQGQSVEEEKQGLLRELTSVQNQIRELADKGQSGHFHHHADTSAKATFLSNLSARDKARSAMRRSQIQLAESKAVGSSDEVIRQLENRVEQYTLSHNNLRDLVEREKMIPNFWIPPSALHEKLANRAEELESQLRLI